MVLDGDIHGLAAIGLWALAGSQSNLMGAGTDGLVSRADLVRLVLDPAIADKLANLLVANGLWHGPGHDCEKCPPVPTGSFRFHDWFQMGYTPAKQVAVNRDKRKELKEKQLVAQVWARDCIDPANPTIGRCRYCGATVKRKDTVSERKPHLDHVDPAKAVGIRNVVLACGQCNQKKGNRTPREAGMTLLPPLRPEPVSDDERHVAGSAVGTDHAAGPSGSGSSRTDEHAGSAPAAPESAGRSSSLPDRGGQPAARPQAGDVAGPSTDEPAAPADDRAPADHPPDQHCTTAEPPCDQPGFTVPGGRGPGQGQGQGVGRGLGKGGSPGLPQPAAQRDSPSKARRRRRRGRNRQPAQQEPPQPTDDFLDAGAPPPGITGPNADFGSPYFAWRGPPSSVTDTDCATHGLPEPCWKCANQSER